MFRIFSSASARSQQFTDTDELAAVDLGSNSFHLIIARYENGQIRITDRLREMVQLGAGLDQHCNLSSEAEERALDCLRRFGQRLVEIPGSNVRIVGTSALRRMANGELFLAKAEDALNHGIEIISGIEEARLIYLGVAHSVGSDGGQRLVIDIGGGSTEIILGSGFETGYLESLRMGCVSVSKLFFSQGVLGKQNLQQAILSVCLKLDGLLQQDSKPGWQEAVGASGSVRAIARVVQAQGWCEDGISFSAMKKLRKRLFEYKHVDELDFEGLEEKRREVFAGGFAILYGLFKSLSIEHMRVADGALREGVLYDLIGRLRHEDVRERTVAAMSKRYGIDQLQAQRVADSAHDLYEQVALHWDLNDEEHLNLLLWASRLYEAGLTIAHSGYHKHGAYLAANADMPGFSRQEQASLAALIRGHRRRFPVSVFKNLPVGLRSSMSRLCVLLRLAVRLNRSRTDSGLVRPQIKIKDEKICMIFPPGHLATNELTLAELDQEAGLLQEAGWELCTKGEEASDPV